MPARRTRHVRAVRLAPRLPPCPLLHPSQYVLPSKIQASLGHLKPVMRFEARRHGSMDTISPTPAIPPMFRTKHGPFCPPASRLCVKMPRNKVIRCGNCSMDCASSSAAGCSGVPYRTICLVGGSLPANPPLAGSRGLRCHHRRFAGPDPHGGETRPRAKRGDAGQLHPAKHPARG